MTGPAWSFHAYALPLREPYVWARGRQQERRGLLVRLELDGCVGWGECAPAPHQVPGAEAMVAGARALARHADAASPRFLSALDAASTDPRLRCGLATAWLDARAQAAREPLATALARRAGIATVRPRVSVNALVGAVAPAEAARLAAQAVAAGHGTLKVKCTDDRDADVARVAAVRQAAPACRLRVDANGAWGAAWARDHLLQLAGHGIEYVEDPVEGDVAFLAAWERDSPVPVAWDAPVTGPTAVQELLAGGARRFIVKPQRVGGPDRAAHLLRFIAAGGAQAVVTTSLETAIGTAAALHCAALLPADAPACGLGTGALLADDVAAAIPVRDGHMEVPRRPGLGVAVVGPVRDAADGRDVDPEGGAPVDPTSLPGTITEDR